MTLTPANRQHEPVIPFWEPHFEERLERALASARSLKPEVLTASSDDILTDGLINDYSAADIVPLYDEVRLNTADAHPASEPALGPLQLIFTMPCQGAAALLAVTDPSAVQRTFGSGDRFEVMSSLLLDQARPADQNRFTQGLANARNAWFSQIADATEAANETIRRERARMRTVVGTVISRRRSAQQLVQTAASHLDIPLNREPGSTGQMTLHPRIVNLAMIEASAHAGGDEAGLAADIADALVEQLGAFGRALERMPFTADRLVGANEEALRDVVLFILNTNWRGAATSETFIGGGKSDILLRWRDRDAFIGECKIWHGEKGFDAGLEQLLSRYTVWRATRVALLLFIRDRVDITAVIDKAVERIRSHSRYIGPARPKTAGEASYLMSAQNDQRKIVTLTLLPVVIPRRSRQDPSPRLGPITTEAEPDSLADHEVQAAVANHRRLSD